MAQARAGTRAGIASPNAADGDLAVRLLGQGGIEARAFGSLVEMATALDEAFGCLILVEEALLAEQIPVLREALARLPAWCDMPLVVVAADIARIGDVVAGAFPASGNVALLGRPLSPHTLVSAVRVALRASARQRELGELVAEREQAVRYRDEFLAMLAHELRNPLAPMRNALYVLRAVASEDARVVKSTEILDRQVDHVVRLVDDLLDVARLERGKVVLQKQRLDLNRVVASATQNCLQSAQAKGHRISLRLAKDALPVDADAVRLEQIVCNLVNNAAKFSMQADEIRVETCQAADFAEVAVADRGIGFEPDKAKHLFDPFLQVNPTLERTAGGLGLGLTIVKRLAELHGGSVEAASGGLGQGARFVVRLPIARTAAAAAPHAARAPARPQRRSIVVIEDNPDIRDTLRMLLEMWGHDIEMADDGPSGVELVLRSLPQVALIDIGLPGMNGYDVARAIRKTIPNGQTRLIAVTGYGQPSDRDQALEAGFDAHLLKPIEPESLERMLAGQGGTPPPSGLPLGRPQERKTG